jgi:hypothetical protein
MANLSKEALPPISSYPSTNYYGPHITKADYDRAFNKARLWALESEEHRPTTIIRIYHIKELTMRKSVLWLKQKARNALGLYNTWGGNNKILNNT